MYWKECIANNTLIRKKNVWQQKFGRIWNEINKVLRNCSSTGVLMAHPLLRQIKITGASITAAKFIPAWKSPYNILIGQIISMSIVMFHILLLHCLLREMVQFIITNLTSASIPTISDCTCTFPIHFKGISSTNSLRKLCSEFLANQQFNFFQSACHPN